MKSELQSAHETMVKALSDYTKAQSYYHSVLMGKLYGDQSAPAATETPSAPAAPDTPSAPDTPAAPEAPAATDTGVVLDDEGIPWDEEIHAKSKGQVASKTVKNGKAWRLLKGVDKDFAEKRKAELKAQYANQSKSESAPELPGTPEAPAAPPAPGVPGVPSAPGVPPAPATGAIEGGELQTDEDTEKSRQADADRKETVKVMMALKEQFNFDHNDCKEVMSEEFGSAQKDENGVVFGGLKFEQYAKVREFFEGLLNTYGEIKSIVDRLYGMAGDANKASVDAGVSQILSGFNTEEIGGIHYSEVNNAQQIFHTWLNQWLEAGYK